MKWLLTALFFTISAFPQQSSAQASQFDPRLPLGQIISAFQVCGPPQVYQIFSPNLFQAVSMQTGGRGCYQAIANAGPVLRMNITEAAEFPIGPLYSILVEHQGGPVLWFIGFNRLTQRVEYLNFQPVQSFNGIPSIGSGLPNGEGPSKDDQPIAQSKNESNECTMYPVMCPKKK